MGRTRTFVLKRTNCGLTLGVNTVADWTTLGKGKGTFLMSQAGDELWGDLQEKQLSLVARVIRGS